MQLISAVFVLAVAPAAQGQAGPPQTGLSCCTPFVGKSEDSLSPTAFHFIQNLQSNIYFIFSFRIMCFVLSRTAKQ